MVGFMTMMLGIAAVAVIIGKVKHEVKQREFQRRIDSAMERYGLD